MLETPTFEQESAVLLSSESHGGEDVPIYSSGPMSFLFTGTVEQSYIAHAMAYSACIGVYNNDDCRSKRGIDEPMTTLNPTTTYISIQNNSTLKDSGTALKSNLLISLCSFLYLILKL